MRHPSLDDPDVKRLLGIIRPIDDATGKPLSNFTILADDEADPNEPRFRGYVCPSCLNLGYVDRMRPPAKNPTAEPRYWVSCVETCSDCRLGETIEAGRQKARKVKTDDVEVDDPRRSNVATAQRIGGESF